jgi:tRNA nucleotidyltransferase (CCA-adding enzyme)
MLVGGAVRDLLLGRAVGELDIVVEGDAKAIAAELAGELRTSFRAHEPFATAAVSLASGEFLDIATARREIYPAPAALPQVYPGTLEDDLHRRDFTINALAFDLHPFRFGELSDPTGGLGDIRRKLIRVLHDGSFIDDPTRVFRAVRFAERLRFDIEPSTLRLMQEAIPEGVERLSADRLRKELDLFLEEAPLTRVAAALGESGLLAAVFREEGGATLEAGLLERVDRLIEELAPQSGGPHPLRLPLLAWSCLIASQKARAGEGASADRWCERLSLRKEERSLLRGLAQGADKVAGRLREAGRSRSGIYFALAGCRFEEVIAAGALDESLEPAVRLYLGELVRVRIQLGGEDLQQLGVKPGRRLGRILRELLAARLDGSVMTREDEIALARRLARKPG